MGHKSIAAFALGSALASSREEEDLGMDDQEAELIACAVSPPPPRSPIASKSSIRVTKYWTAMVGRILDLDHAYYITSQ